METARRYAMGELAIFDLRVQYCAESLRVLLAELVHGGVCAPARLAVCTQRSLSSLLLCLHLCSSRGCRKAFG